jgi:4-amino-4-deoxy-L-arabinose transferase-like glycosyltransferase
VTSAASISHQSFRYFIALVAVALPLFCFGTTNHGLWSADEPRVAEIGREMAETGNWVVPMLNQKPFLEHPPLYYACLGITFKLMGAVTDGVARIPSAVFAFGGVIVLFFLANYLFGPRVAFISGFVMASSTEYFRVAHWVMVDSALTFFVITAMSFFIVGYRSQDRLRKTGFYALCYVACSLAFLVKGFIAIAIPGVAVLAFLAFDRNLKEILKMHLWLGVLIFAAIALPWFIQLHGQGGGEFSKVFLLHNHLQRFLVTKDAVHLGHRHPFYYYLTEFPAGFLPWSILLVPAFVTAFSGSRPGKSESQKNMLFAKCWFFAGFVILSIAATKRTVYLLPIFAPISMMIALTIDSTLDKTDFTKVEKPFMWAFGVVVLLMTLAAVPGLIYSAKLIHMAVVPRDMVLTVLASFVSLCFAAAGIIFLWRHEGKGFWLCSGASLYVFALFVLLLILPLVDQFKSFVPFCKEISRIVPREKVLYGYQADETLRGAVPFYTGRYMNEIEDISQVKKIVAGQEPVYMVTRDVRGKAEKELLNSGKLRVLHRQDMGTDRSLLLLSNK